MTSYLVRLVAGPLAFALIYALPLALSYQGRIAFATFVCAIVWWMTQPLPWAMAAMLPFLVFPAAGVMDIAETMRLYGQPIFFWIMGTVLMGYAIEKHGLAHRFALALLALPGIGGNTYRLTFVYMLIVGIISMFISDAATIAMTIPIGMSVVHHVRLLAGAPPEARTNFGAFITLGTFYASVAGGTATIMGVPHNAISVSLLEQFTGRQLGFFEWMRVGLPVFVVLLAAFYATLSGVRTAGDPRHPERRGVPPRRAGHARPGAAERAAGPLRVRDDGDALHAAGRRRARARSAERAGRMGDRAPSPSGWCRRR